MTNNETFWNDGSYSVDEIISENRLLICGLSIDGLRNTCMEHASSHRTGNGEDGEIPLPKQGSRMMGLHVPSLSRLPTLPTLLIDIHESLAVLKLILLISYRRFDTDSMGSHGRVSRDIFVLCCQRTLATHAGRTEAEGYTRCIS